MNRARYIFIGIVLDDDGMFNLQLVDNQANNCSNLLLIRCKYNFVQPSFKDYITLSVYSFQTCFSRAWSLRHLNLPNKLFSTNK